MNRSIDLEPGAHVTLDGGTAMYAATPSGVAFRLMPDAGGWIDAARVAYVTGYDEHNGLYDPDEDDDPDGDWDMDDYVICLP